MRYKIKDIPSDGMLDQQELGKELLADAFQGLDVDLDATTGNVRVELHYDRDDENVFVHGDLKALVTVPCAKCLGPALVHVDVPLNMTFVADAGKISHSDDPLEDVDVDTHDRVHVDLTPIIREQLILALPISARCRENCVGLCTVCGLNKNEINCGHVVPALGDPRFSALEKLKLS
jgi:uncharacterized protein